MQTFEPSRVHARAVVRLGLRSLGPESLWARPNSCRTDLSHHHQRTHGRITIDRVPALAHPFACVKTRRGTSFAQGTKDSGASASATAHIYRHPKEAAHREEVEAVASLSKSGRG